MTTLYRKLIGLTTVLALFLSTGVAFADVDPPEVQMELQPGQSVIVEKTVTTPAIPAVVDVCLLEDETGSFADDIGNLQGGTTAEDLYDTVIAESPDAQFAVAGFRDYPIDPFGSPGDHVYRLLSSMDPTKTAWLSGIMSLTAGTGGDTPEAQYDAIVAAAGPGPFEDPSLGPQADCGWRAPEAGAQRVLVVAVDSPFHLPGEGKPHVNDHASTVTALDAQGIAVLGLEGPGAASELDNLVASLASGGSVQPLNADGANIGQAILDGLQEITTDVWWEVEADAGLNVSLEPMLYEDVAGDTAVTFQETIEVPMTTAPGEYHATVTFFANQFPEEGEVIGVQEITITVVPISADIDIKPGSDPNAVNVNERGRGGSIPVAILSTADFDATTMVDPETVTLSNGGEPGTCWTTPGSEDVNGDGLLDQVYHCENDPPIFACGDTEGFLRGSLLDGSAFEGSDTVKTVPCKP